MAQGELGEEGMEERSEHEGDVRMEKGVEEMGKAGKGGCSSTCEIGWRCLRGREKHGVLEQEMVIL